MTVYLVIGSVVAFFAWSYWIYELAPRKYPNVLSLKDGDIEQVIHVHKYDNILYIFMLRKNKEVKIYCGIVGDNIDSDDEHLHRGSYMIKKCNRGFIKNLVEGEGKCSQYYISFMPV